MATNEFLIGKRERMSWIVESSYATGGSMGSGEIVGYDCQIEPDWNQGWQEILAGGADDRLVQAQVIGPKSLPYTMTFTPSNWRWIKYLMAVVDADDTGIKTHTFTVGNTVNTYKLEWAKRHTTNHVYTIIGNFVKKGTLSFQKATGEGTEGFMKVALECVGQNDSQGSSVTSLSNLSRTPVQFRMVKVTIDGTEFREVNNGEMSIEAGIDEADSRYCNSTYDNLVGEPIPKTFRIKGRYNINIKNKDLYDLWAAGVAVSGTCTLLIDIDGTGDDQLLATFSNFFIHGAVAATELEGVTAVDVVWSALAFTSLVARDNITTY